MNQSFYKRMKTKKISLFTLMLALAFSSCANSSKNNNKSISETAITAENKSTSENSKKNTNAQIMAKPEIPVLCYHRIMENAKGDYAVTPAIFASHMKILADSGYHSISPAQLYDYLVYNKQLPNKPFLITFDDSRVEHAAIAAPILEKHGFRGAFFIMTITYNKKNYMSKDQIAQLAKKGHTIGLHSWDHTMVIKYKEAADWLKEVAEPKKKLESIVAMPVEYWAYPNGVYDHKGAAELSKYFKISFTLFSKRDADYPLQTVRRIIVPTITPQKLLKAMRGNFKVTVNK